ncbi:Toll/interleukin-1 receptor domain-containing protein, partial [Tanacetum coccineum]
RARDHAYRFVMASSEGYVSRYDVFLSFRGETRHGFTDHLYEKLENAGVYTFRDNNNIRIGEDLKPEFKRAIRESRASIIVLSDLYATSRWCLDELYLILQERKRRNHFVLPIFYHVNPSHVRKREENFKIEARDSNWTEDKMKRWNKALKKVGNMAGKVSSGYISVIQNWNNRFFWVDEKVFSTFVDWRVDAPKDAMPLEGSYSVEDTTTLTIHQMGLFNLISAPNPAKVKTGTRPRAAHEFPLLASIAKRVINMEDVTGTSESSETPSAVEKSPLDFADEEPPQTITEAVEEEGLVQEETQQESPSAEPAATAGVMPETSPEEEAAAMGPSAGKKRKQLHRKRVNDGTEANVPPKVLRKDHVFSPTQETLVSDPNPLSYAKPRPDPQQDVAESSKAAGAKDPNCEKSTSSISIRGSPGVPSGYFSELHHLPNDEFLNQYNINLARKVTIGSQLRLRYEQGVRLLRKAKAQCVVSVIRRRTWDLLEAEVDMKKAAEVKNAELTKELESLLIQFADLQGSNNQLSDLQAQVAGEEKIKAAFEEFKKYEDGKVEQQCAEMDARLDALSIDFDEELYPHMLTVIADRRWVIGHGLRLVVMKCAESTELRQAFADVVTAGIAKGMSEGLEHGIEHGKAGPVLADVEAYDLEANKKLTKALQDLKDLKYPLVDQLEKLRDASIDLIMASLHLESDTGKMPLSGSKTSALVPPNLKFLCIRRSDGVPVSAPTVIPQGLQILKDAAAQTEPPDDDSTSPRLVRSKSLSAMSEVEFSQQIVKIIKEKLNFIQVYRQPNLVGMDTRDKEINAWLGNSDDGEILVIWGIDGGGKSTLAMHIVCSNWHKFESVSILEDIGSRSPEELRQLQEKLIRDITEGKEETTPSVCQGTYQIKKALKTNKAIVVLDNIVTKEQLDKFLGTATQTDSETDTQIETKTKSKIIITTTEKNASTWFQSTSWRCKEHEIKLLDDVDSLKLLELHGFKPNAPMDGYEEFAKRALLCCQGNPLALKVWGSSLCCDNSYTSDRRKHYWESMMTSLERQVPFNIQEVLIKSYSSLQQEHVKELFLHIACFFNGKDKDYVEKILEPDYNAVSGIVTLINSCFLSVSPDNKLIMHRLLQDMGRTIVLAESPRLPGDRSRVWRDNESHEVLRKDTGSTKVLGLALDMDILRQQSEKGKKKLSNTVNTISFEKMKSLKLLQLNEFELEGSYMNIFKDLRWLCWRKFCLREIPPELDMENLVAIDMSCSKLEVFQPPAGVTSYSVKRLLLKDCNLESSDEFLHFRDQSLLEYLNLANNPFEILPNHNHLKQLLVLDLTGCEKLKMLICLPRNLAELYISNCDSLERVTFESHKYTLQEFRYKGCLNLFEVEDLFKLVPVSKLKDTDLGNMKWLREYQDREVFLVGDGEVTKGRNVVRVQYNEYIPARYREAKQDSRVPVYIPISRIVF